VTDPDTAAPETAAPETEAPETEAPEDAVDTDEVAAPTEPVAESDDDDDENAEDGETDDGKPRPSRSERLVLEGEIAADYLEELLEIADLDGDLDMDVEGDRATVSVVGADLPQLVGDQGEVLEALQELTRLAVYRETGERSRLMLDVSGHRANRRSVLEEQASEIVAQVKDSGERAVLEPMSPFERKVVHDIVAAAGLKSESEGAEPRRYVVVLPA
jgi:spoIIIJ-associated protein